MSVFMTKLITNIVNPKIDQMSAFSGTQIKTFTVNATVPDGSVLANMWNQSSNFSLWDLAYRFSDRPWNEIWVSDSELGPVFNFRPVPYKDLVTGALIMPGASDPGTINVDIADVVATTETRTDARVANLFIVDPGAATLDSNGFINITSIQTGNAADFNYAANSPSLFGVRMMEAGTQLLPTGQTQPYNLAGDAAVQKQAAENGTQWFIQRMNELKSLHRDDSNFADVGFVLRGQQFYQVGQYLQLTEGDIVSTSYINAVSQHIQPLGIWSTSLHCCRSTGFYERNKSPVSPYLAEGRRGPY